MESCLSKCWVGQKVMSKMTCIWFERVLYANYDYIRNLLIKSIYIYDYLRRAVFAKFSSFNNCCNARVEVNYTALYCRLLLVLQSPTLNLETYTSFVTTHELERSKIHPDRLELKYSSNCLLMLWWACYN